MIKPLYNSVKADCKKSLGNTQVIISSQITVKDAEVKKVLSTCCEANITSWECLNGSVVFMGRANYKILALDSNNNLSSLNYNADFSDKYSNESITPNSKLSFKVEVSDTDIKSMNGSNVVVNAVIEIAVYANSSAEANCLIDGDGIYAKKDKVNLGRLVCSCLNNFELEANGDAKHNIAKMLMAESVVDVNTLTPNFDSVMLVGAVYSRITYLTAVDNEIECMTLEIPFKEELPCEGVTPNTVLELNACVKSTKVKLDILEDKENNTFIVSVVVKTEISGTEKTEIECVTDAFSLENKLEVTASSIESSLNLGYFSGQGKVSGTISLTNDDMPLERYLNVLNPKVVIVSKNARTDYIEIEGIICGNAVYKIEDNINSVIIELPFTDKIEMRSVTPNCLIEVSAITVELTCRKGKGKDLEINATIKYCINSFTHCIESIISGIKEGEIKKENKTAIEVFVGKKGETFWEISKNLNMSEDLIKKFNPDLITPLSGGEKIVVYRKAKI